jgi:long-chain fatty acid transport protein
MRAKVLLIAVFVIFLSAPFAYATNGDNLIAIGPIARSMGGVGIAAPQDAISAVFSNPAAMCFAPYCPSTEVDFAGTLFMPHINAKVTTFNPRTGTNTTFAADADDKVYAIPAIGLSYPISNVWPFWRFGLAAYGVSGLGVDYRGTNLNQGSFFGTGAPLAAGTYTNLQIMKFAPSIAAQPMERLSLGLALHIDYASLDLGQGSSSNYGVGAQAGLIYKLTDSLSLGANYVSPQNVNHDNVADFDGDGVLDRLQLQSPQQFGIGLAYTTLDNKLLLEGDVKWINWSGANGYDDFDWKDQWVFAVGAQYFLTPKLSLRTGYNYGANPVREHNSFTPLKTVQGHTMPTYYYETFRVIGFPAVVEHHITFGLGYQITDRFGLHAGYMHAFSNTIQETGIPGLVPGTTSSLESTLSEDSVDFGLTWRF